MEKPVAGEIEFVEVEIAIKFKLIWEFFDGWFWWQKFRWLPEEKSENFIIIITAKH